MSDFNHLERTTEPIRRIGGIVSNSDQPPWVQKANEFQQQLFSGAAFLSVVRAVGEWVPRLMRMQRKDVPQKDGPLNFGKNGPDNRCSALRDRLTSGGTPRE